MTAPEVHEALAEVLAAHVRGDWSDRTYNCQGCAERFERAAQERFDALGRKPTREELVEFRSDYSKISHPRWSLAEYNFHLASVLADHFAEAVTEARARELREAAEVIRDVRENGLPAGVTSHPYSELFERWLLARADSLAPETSGAEGDGIECPTSAVTAASHDSAPELALARVIEVVEMYESCGPKQQSTRDVLAAVRTAALAPEAPSEVER